MIYDKIKLKTWGAQASKKLLEDKVPLLDSVRLIAESNDLNKEQIKRVCEYANTQTMLKIYESKEDNTSEFNVVDPKDIIDKISKFSKTAFVNRDYSYEYDFKQNMAKLAMSINKSDLRPNSFKKYAEYDNAKKKDIRINQALNDAKYMFKVASIKYAGKIEELAKVITKAKKSGATEREMLEALSALPYPANVVKSAFNKSLEYIKSNGGGFLSNLWDKAKGFFKFSSDGSVAVDAEYISSKLSDSSGSKINIVNKKHPLVAKFEEINTSHDEAGNAAATLATIENAANDSKAVLERLSKDIGRKTKC